MTIIEWEKKESVAFIYMCNNANVHNLEFVIQMNQCFDEILKDNEIFSIILTSSDEKNFSQGIDIKWFEQTSKDQDFNSINLFLQGINEIFIRILLMPVPVVAAINGHAFGNGAILSCACDFRFMTKDKGFFCFPEVDLDIPFSQSMIAFVRQAIPEYKFNAMILSGRRVGAQELQDHHIIVKACKDKNELLKDTFEFAAAFKKKRGIFGELKKRMYKDIVKIISDNPLKLERI